MNFYKCFESYAKCPVNGYLHRGPVGEPGGGSFAEISERKEEVHLGSFLGTRGHYYFKSGAIWNFSKGTGLS